jgi:hypothetical protein
MSYTPSVYESLDLSHPDLIDIGCQTVTFVDSMRISPQRREFIANKLQPLLTEITKLCVDQMPNDPALCIATHLVETRNLRMAADYELDAIAKGIRKCSRSRSFSTADVQVQTDSDSDFIGIQNFDEVYHCFVDEGLNFLSEPKFRELAQRREFRRGEDISEPGIYVIEKGFAEVKGKFLKRRQSFSLEAGNKAEGFSDVSMVFIPFKDCQVWYYAYLVEELRKIPCFLSLSEEKLKELVNELQPETWKRGTHQINTFFIIERGHCRIGERLLRQSNYEGEIFLCKDGEQEEIASLTVNVTSESALVLLLKKESYLKICQSR